jgi:hypothetical protein
VTRIFDTEKKDFSMYRSVKNGNPLTTTKADHVPVRFALQFGEGSLEGSNDYYEWSSVR